MLNEPKNIENEDWRLQAISTLSREFRSPSGIVHPVGTPVSQLSSIPFDGKVLSFRAPSITALFLDFAYNLHASIDTKLASENFVGSKSKTMIGVIHHKNEGDLFEAIEMLMGEIIFSYSALESFANGIIPSTYVYMIDRNDGKCKECYNKEQIERNVKLDIKLSEILPSIKNIPSPKGGPLWNKYMKLKELRDRIIHKKTNDKTSASPEENSFWKSLIGEKNKNFAVEAKAIMEYYFTNEESKPRWLRKNPLN